MTWYLREKKETRRSLEKLDTSPQSSSTVNHKLLKIETLFWQCEVHCFGDLTRMVEVKYLTVSVVGLVDEVKKNLNDGVKELAGGLLRVRSRGDRKDVPEGLRLNVQVLLGKEARDIKASFHGRL